VGQGSFLRIFAPNGIISLNASDDDAKINPNRRARGQHSIDRPVILRLTGMPRSKRGSRCPALRPGSCSPRPTGVTKPG